MVQPHTYLQNINILFDITNDSWKLYQISPVKLALRPSTSPRRHKTDLDPLFLINTHQKMSLIKENLIEELKELESSRDEITSAITQTQKELEKAKAKQKITGEYSDAEWFIGAKSLVREKTVLLHETSRKIKQIKSQLGRPSVKANYFQEAAKKILPEEEYKKINILADNWLLNKIENQSTQL